MCWEPIELCFLAPLTDSVTSPVLPVCWHHAHQQGLALTLLYQFEIALFVYGRTSHLSPIYHCSIFWEQPIDVATLLTYVTMLSSIVISGCLNLGGTELQLGISPILTVRFEGSQPHVCLGD